MIPHLFSSKKEKLYRAIKSVQKAKLRSSLKLKVRILIHLDGIKNAREKKSFEKLLEKKVGPGVYCTWCEKNIGFVGGINKAINFARKNLNFDWFIILNDDAVLVENFFSWMESYFYSRDIDVVSGIIKNINGTTESFGLEYYQNGIALGNTKDNNPEYFCATCFCLSGQMIEREIKRNGYVFNPLFFIYAEDLELSLRLIKDNRKIQLIPEIIAIHEGSSSVGYLSYIQVYCSFRNWIYIILLLWDRQLIMSNIKNLIVCQLKFIKFTIVRRYYFIYPHMIKDLIKNSFQLFQMRLNYRRNLKEFNKPFKLKYLSEPPFL